MIKKHSRDLFDCDYCDFKNECGIRNSPNILPLSTFELTSGVRLTCEDFMFLWHKMFEVKIKLDSARLENEED